ncbi:uncharacterized protein Z519_07582 [Cladophialophora bantiana CBS 173.52]|uniref:Microsomal epoxide hydrolase n=1 Tax=Cladophialophora bantiana (strain ATCC 10958 / CBS 173.52 / CDC B-1940 / NIH 8579) TaxID=1442370 RepID=A0A0D2I3Z8_CLAB1|nr:uncharacterized protein Z519_07582 [Cladophialophora bantiana CBS 173.52]KIW91614.1 hypothetical protein Z519_07582 [Cladophialophora bantiana CBS 173.52]
MSPASPPKALLFDIGGVCVASPLKAILDFEHSQRIPVGWINYAIGAKSPSGPWQTIERGEAPLDAAWFAWFKKDLEDPLLWEEFHAKLNRGLGSVPPVPSVDVQNLFWYMMGIVRNRDEHMFSALQKLRASQKFVMAALSNNVTFPEGHPYNDLTPALADLMSQFDAVILSANVGLRKPEPRIFEVAVQQIDKIDRERSGMGVSPEEILFLDDIGENLKTATQLGFKTIKVRPGKIENAVKELEEATGESLVDKKGAKL